MFLTNKIGFWWSENMETIKGKIRCKVGKYNCRCNYKIVGVTASAIEDMNKILAKEEQNERIHTEQG